MIKVDGYDAFRIVETLRLHYTKPSFDVNQYGYGGPRVSPEQWVKLQGEKLVYDVIADDFGSEKEVAALCCGTFVMNPTIHCSELRYQIPHQERMMKWLNEPLRSFEEQVECLAGKYRFRQLFNKSEPVILDLMVRGKLDPEFLVILNRLCPFHNKLDGHYVWDLMSMRLKRHEWLLREVLNDLAPFSQVAKARLKP